MDELVSIITPCYNGGEFVMRLFDSVLNQTYPSIEFIFINDGSTDNTDDIVKEYIPKFENKAINFIYINQINQGQAAAINRGLEVYKGTYVTWPDSDDFYESKDSILEMVNALRNSDDSVSTVRCQAILREGTSLNSVGLLKHRHPMNKSLFYNAIFEYDFWFTPGCYMGKSEILNRVLQHKRIYESRGGQNWQLFLPLFYGYESIYIEKPLFNYLIRTSSHSHNVKNSLSEQKDRANTHEDILCQTVYSLKDIDQAAKTKLIKKIQEKYAKKRFNLGVKFKDRELAKNSYEQLKLLTSSNRRKELIMYKLMEYPFCISLINKLFTE